MDTARALGPVRHRATWLLWKCAWAGCASVTHAGPPTAGPHPRGVLNCGNVLLLCPAPSSLEGLMDANAACATNSL